VVGNGSEDTDAGKYRAFFVIWALKESYIKAIGQGLGFPLNQVLTASCLIAVLLSLCVVTTAQL
jgi:phosphopantetheinyl transferase